MEKLPTIKELRQNGYKVRVIRRRVYKFIRKSKLHKALFTRRQADETLTVEGTQNGLQNYGGETRIEIRTPEGNEVWGEAFCHKVDNFNRKSGRDEALARAMEHVSPEELAALESALYGYIHR